MSAGKGRGDYRGIEVLWDDLKTVNTKEMDYVLRTANIDYRI